MLARSKLIGMKSKISQALINNEISHEDIMKLLKNYQELKQNIRMMKSQKK